MKKVSEADKRYYPAEEAESKMFLFDDIIDCTTDNLNKVGKSTRYKIKNSQGEYSVMTDQIRNEKMEMSEAEKKYWFYSILKDQHFDPFVVRK